MSDPHTIRIFKWLRQVHHDEELWRLAKNLATHLIEYVNRETGDAFVSQRRLARELGASRTGLQEALYQLVRREHLAMTVRRESGQTNLCRPVLKEEGVPSVLGTPPANLDGQGVPSAPGTIHLSHPLRVLKPLIDDGGGGGHDFARARERDAALLTLAAALVTKIAVRAGLPPDRNRWPSKWQQSANATVAGWLKTWSGELVLLGVERTMLRKHDGPPASIRYFEKEIAKLAIAVDEPRRVARANAGR